jgi:hypothetical protein
MSDVLIFTKHGSTITWAPGTHLHQAVMCHLNGDIQGMESHMDLALKASNVRENHVVDQTILLETVTKGATPDAKII